MQNVGSIPIGRDHAIERAKTQNSLGGVCSDMYSCAAALIQVKKSSSASVNFLCRGA